MGIRIRHSLTAMGLIASATLVGKTPENGNCDDTCCQTAEPICCECKGEQSDFHPLQNESQFLFDVEFLHWYAKENNLPYAAEVLTKIAGSNTSFVDEITFAQCLHELDATWDPGFRVGIGWQDKCDGIDGLLCWTHFNHSENDSAITPSFSGQLPMALGESALFNPFPQRSVSENPFFKRICASWKTHLNQIDLEFGKKYLLSHSSIINPYIGLRGAWTKTRFHVKGDSDPQNLNPIEVDFTQKSRDSYTNRIWGVGLLSGFQPTWYFCSSIALYGNFSGALIWGKHEEEKIERFHSHLFDTLENREKVFVDSHNQFGEQSYQMSALLDLAIGVRWESSWCSNHLLTALDLGWEHHTWFSHSKRFRTYNMSGTTPQFNQFDLQSSDLGYGGLVVRFCLEL